MEWKYVKALKSAELISEYEKKTGYVFDEAFKKCVMENNGGRPAKKVFDTDKTKERELKSFLSFNREDRETVWKILEWNKEELTDKYVPFVIDGFGNLICFDKSSKKVVFVNHEDLSVEVIANDFEEFMSGLYE